MAARLSNDELAQRVRQRMQRSSAKYRERLSRSGRTQTLVWLPDAIRVQLDGLVEARNLSLSAVTTQLLAVALDTRSGQAASALANPTPLPSPVSVDTLPLFDTATADVEAMRGPSDERLARILALKRQGLSNYAIAGQVGCSEPTVRRALKKQTKEATG